MSPRRGRGSSSPVGLPTDKVRENLSGKLGDANLQAGALGIGRIEHGESVGKQDAKYAKFKTKAATNVYVVGHNLGRVPKQVTLAKAENPADPTSAYVVTPYKESKWTVSTVQVYVTAARGTLGGGIIHIIVAGG